MAKIVYISVGMPSTLSASFELSHRLQRAGHQVHFVSHVDIGTEVDANGYPFVLLKNDRALQARWDDSVATLNAPRDLASPRGVEALARCRSLRKASVENDEIERVVSALQPDLLIIDIEMHYAVIATASLGLPTVLTCFWFSIFRHAGVPPLHYDLAPPASLPAQLRTEALWLRTRVGARTTVWRRRMTPMGLRSRLAVVPYGTLQLDDLRAVAKAKGYNLRRETDRTHWLRPYVYRRLPIMCFNLREMDFPQRPPATFHYVGPMINQRRVDPPLDPADEARLGALLSGRGGAPTGRRPLVYCSLGSFFAGDPRFLRRVVDVFARRPEWDLILGLGRRLKAEDLGPVPPNVLLLSWAPQIRILRAADGAICHGGISTINECLAFEVPMVIYSTKHVDQPGCAARVRHHRVGVAADKDTDTSDDIERNIEQILFDPEIRANAAKMRVAVDRYQDEGIAEQLVATALRGEHSI